MNIIIRPATAADSTAIIAIGLMAVEEAHRDSCAKADLDTYLAMHYNEAAITAELNDAGNIYHLMYCDGQPAGFSKIVLNASHPNVAVANSTKLDRIYLLNSFYGMGLGERLLAHNVALSKEAGQNALWLFTWTGNKRAVGFYKKHGFTVIGEHMFKITDTHYNPNHQMLLRY